MSHTPGPWTVNTQGLTEYEPGKFFRTCLVSGPGFSNLPGSPIGTAVDDARLIAAAPELLEALRIVERQMNGEMMFPGPVFLSISEANQIVDAIARATQP